MIRPFSVVGIVVLGVASALGQSAAPPQSEQAKVRAAEEEWLLAYYRLDSAALQASEALDFTLLTPSGMVTRDAQVSGLRSRASAGATSSSPAVFTLSGQSIRLYGNVALLTDKCTVTGGGPGGVTSPGTYWQTEVWHNEGGKWKIVHVQISVVEHGM